MKTNSVILLGLLAQGSAWADTLINDTFADGSRTGGSLPGSAQWFTGGAAANTYVTNNNALVVSGLSGGGSVGQGVVASFMPNGGELNLQVGESIVLSFNYQYGATNSSDFGFGFGFYNSNGKPLTADGKGFNNALFNGWTGYSAFGVFGVDPSGLGRMHIAQRETTANNLMSPFTTGVLGPSTHQTDGSTPNTWYSASLTLTYANPTKLLLTATIGAKTYSTSTTPLTTGFDTVAITDGVPQTQDLEVSNVSVVTIPAEAPVPEPSTLALGAAGLGIVRWICWRRQHRTGGF